MNKKIDRIGEININYQGLKMEIINYKNYGNIDIKFEDGTIVYKRKYGNFKSGSIRKDVVYKGLESISKHNEKFTIIKRYRENNATKYDILFENNFIIYGISSSSISNREVRNPYTKSIFDNGYLGEGKYKPTIKNENNKKMTPQYNTWFNMLSRCYNIKYQEKRPTYKGCMVCGMVKFSKFC